MNLHDYADQVMDEIRTALHGLSEAKITALVEGILHADRIFLAGAGRSGLMIKSFAMRLMHLGLKTFVVGDTTTPGIAAGDILIIGSGSGATASLVSMAEKAKQIGAQIAVVTIQEESRLGGLAHRVITIPAPTPKINGNTGMYSVQPMGSLFEQCLLLTLEIVILYLMAALQRDSARMFQNHANLE